MAQTTRGPGRPPVDQALAEATMIRLHAPLAKQIDDWARKQEKLITRPEAIRRLVTAGLAKAK
jgi:hypothetical protein